MRPLREVELNYIETQDEVEECLRWLGERRPVLGFDLETTGLRWWRPEFRIRLAQLGDVDTAWAFRVDRYGALLEKVMTDYTGRITGHNIVGFDFHALRSQGFSLPDFRQVDDTRCMHELAYSQMYTHSLEMVIKQFVGQEAFFAKHLLDQAFEAHGFKPGTRDQEQAERMWTEIPYDCEAYSTYSGMDTISAARGWVELKKRIDSTFAVPYAREMAAWFVTFEHEHRGLRVDRDWAQQLHGEMTRDIEVVLAELASLGLPEPSKKAKLLERLQQDGWVPEVFTKKTKAPMLNKAILKDIDHDLVMPLMEYNRLTKWRKAYVEKVLETAYGGRIYPSFRPIGAKTGRESASNPPIHQLPSKHEDAWKIRRIILAEEGEACVSIDYNAEENRLTYHFSRDKALKNIFDKGLDIHTYTAAAIFAVDYSAVTSEQRSIAKTFRYAADYGAQDAKLASAVGVSELEMAAIRDRVNNAFSGVAEYTDNLIRHCERMYVENREAYVETWGGRLVYIDNAYGHLKTTQIVNARNQGTGADILKETKNKLAAAGYSERIMFGLHDEVLFSVPDNEDGDAMANDMARVMEYTNGEFTIDMTTSRGALTPYWSGH